MRTHIQQLAALHCQLPDMCPHTACAYSTATHVSLYHILLSSRLRHTCIKQVPDGRRPRRQPTGRGGGGGGGGRGYHPCARQSVTAPAPPPPSSRGFSTCERLKLLLPSASPLRHVATPLMGCALLCAKEESAAHETDR